MISSKKNYVADTDFFIGYFRGEANAVATFQKLRQNQLFLSTYTYFELLEGEYYRAPGRVGAMRLWLDNFTVLPFGTGIALVAARHQARLRNSRQALMSEGDLIIGATAVHYGFSLLTRNVKHFASMQKAEKLDIEDWAAV
ncbi:type II toxin-antitoxin system VapC family toxin [Calidithermus roseus]|uniref:tRNA(fMet)-specific endonuclease VapC n=1 Tax=Calidithermus roseus TaxID=1644118 RepID=A0A399F3T6_9DEIN|nr:type II toxin-antitoxin system VapC family toxin [Calidithermus roseus]RIH89271.1 tRNA(fMet)-specific endonuclease VapC [Calidithermus roseus]